MDENTQIPNVNWEKLLLLDDYRHSVLLSCLDPLELGYQEAIKVEMAMLASMEKGLQDYGFTPHGCYQIWVKLYREFQDGCVSDMLRHVIECRLAAAADDVSSFPRGIIP